MKNLVLLMTLVFSAHVFADVGPVGRSASFNAAGTLQAGSLEKWFINVKNTSSATIANGDVVILDVAQDDGYSVTTTVTASQSPHCVMAESCAVSAICSCQTYGLKTDVNFTGDGADAVAGAPAFISTVGGTAGYINGISSPAATDRPVGTFYDASSVTADLEVFIRLR